MIYISHYVPVESFRNAILELAGILSLFAQVCSLDLKPMFLNLEKLPKGSAIFESNFSKDRDQSLCMYSVDRP
jgi:hypothetical protein